jgi:hypothetical protein
MSDYRAWIYEAIGNLRIAIDFMERQLKSHDKEGPMYNRLTSEIAKCKDSLEPLEEYYGRSER